MPKIITKEEKERRKRELIEQVRALSKDGIAPSTHKSNEAHYLAVKCRMYWGSWGEFCKEAGLIPRSEYFNMPAKRYRNPPTSVKKGDLRKALGHFDLLDEARGEVS